MKSSKGIKIYSLLMACLVLLIIGLLGCFYTLSINFNNLNASVSSKSSSCSNYKYDDNVTYSCSDEYKFDEKSKKCLNTKTVDSEPFKCEDGYDNINTNYDTKRNIASFICQKSVEPDVSCKTKGAVPENINGVYRCKYCSVTKKDEKETTSKKNTSKKNEKGTTKIINSTISCYIVRNKKKISIKDEGLAYVNRYIYCKTNKKNATWKVNNKEIKEYKKGIIRFKIDEVNNNVKIVATANKKNYKTTIKVGNYCGTKITAKNNKINVSTNCNSKYSVKSISVYNAYSNKLVGVNYYNSPSNKKINSTISVSKSKYNVKVKVVDEIGNTRTVSKVLLVDGNYYTNTFDLSSDERCYISNYKTENGKYSAKLKCGKNAKISKIYLVDLTNNKLKQIESSDVKKYGYNGNINFLVDNDSNDYRLRVYYTMNNKNKKHGMNRYIVTTEKKFKVYCPSSVKTGDRFMCYVKKPFENSNIEISNEKNKTFINNGKTYVTVYSNNVKTLNVVAKYKEQIAKKDVKIKNANNIKKTKVHLGCSTHAVKTNKNFYCASAIDGVKIVIKCPNKKETKEFTTSIKNNDVNYMQYYKCSSKGEATVTAKKSGYKNNTYKITVQ